MPYFFYYHLSNLSLAFSSLLQFLGDAILSFLVATYLHFEGEGFEARFERLQSLICNESLVSPRSIDFLYVARLVTGFKPGLGIVNDLLIVSLMNETITTKFRDIEGKFWLNIAELGNIEQISFPWDMSEM